MGGICGYISNKNIEKQTLSNMEEAIINRGKYIKQFNEKNVGIANLNHKNDNYKFLNTENLIISIDGEIDNKTEICQNLKINTLIDVEILEKLYEKYGEKFVKQIEGFFSIVIYDKKEKKLIMVRDKIGVKPLYYYAKENSICFASELKAIMHYPKFTKEINYDALSRYFIYSYINPPNTIFKNTYKLEQGHYIIWKDGKIKNRTYWDGIKQFNKISKKPVNDFEEAKENVDNMLKNYLKKIMKTNNNIGIYLSGGIDSSLIAAVCSKISEKPINTISIGFYEKERNEADNAKKIANYLGTNHYEHYIDKDEALEIIKKIPEYYDEPFADASQLPTIALAEFAKKNGITMAIIGDGADQLFCGNKIYDLIHKTQKDYIKKHPFSRKIEIQEDFEPKIHIYKGLLKSTKESIMYKYGYKVKSNDWQIKRMILDVHTSLPNKVNTKIDRANSNNEIEIKGPFLENKLIEYGFRVPHKFKYYENSKKYILKKLLYQYIPKELIEEEKKGFGIPTQKWLKTYFYDDLMRVSNKEFIKKQDIFNYDKLQQLIENKDNKFPIKTYQIVWAFYMFQLWYIKYIENEK